MFIYYYYYKKRHIAHITVVGNRAIRFEALGNHGFQNHGSDALKRSALLLDRQYGQYARHPKIPKCLKHLHRSLIAFLLPILPFLRAC
jgi:hypothetical protein